MALRILIAEDDINTRTALRALLEIEGYLVHVCEDGPAALAHLHGRGCDVLLTDLKMPGMTGLELALAARTVQPHLRCYIMTGLPGPHGDGAELVGWLRKPVDFHELVTTLAE